MSLFGPGVGEAAAIHVGGGEWLLVDSCIDSRTGRIATLSYLDSIGLDPARSVLWVVATHAHDDHIGGLSEIVSACSHAQVILPQASSSEEFLALAGIDERLTYYDTRWTVYDEYRRLFSELELRDQFSSLVWGEAGIELPLGAALRGDRVRILFLAPSSLATTRATKVFGRMLHASTHPRAGERIARRDPNFSSAAFLVFAGDVAMLLGGDVVRGAAGWGWRHIVESFPFDSILDAIKVAHHGDPSGYAAEVWTDWAKTECIAAVTPYRPSQRPRPPDILRMCAHGRPLWQTATSTSPAASREVKRTSAKLRQVTRGPIAEVGGRMGHLRIRWKAKKSEIAAFGPAFRVC